MMKILIPTFFIRICIRIWLNMILQNNVNDKKNLMQETKPSLYVLYEVLLVWNNGSVIRWSKWSEKTITKQVNFVDPADPAIA